MVAAVFDVCGGSAAGKVGFGEDGGQGGRESDEGRSVAHLEDCGLRGLFMFIGVVETW